MRDDNQLGLLQAALEAFTDAHEREIAAFIRPLAEDVIAHGMGVLEANLAEALQRHDGNGARGLR